VLDLAAPGARLVFSCGWHISRDVAIAEADPRWNR